MIPEIRINNIGIGNVGIGGVPQVGIDDVQPIGVRSPQTIELLIIVYGLLILLMLLS